MTISVDVLVPVYRCAKYLNELIASCYKLTRDDLDIAFFFGVDASPDDEFHMLHKILDGPFMGEFPRSQVLNLPTNVGPASMRNILFDRGSGTYICWLDADDVFTPRSIIDRVVFMETWREVEFAYGSYWTFRGDLTKSIEAGHLGDPDIKPFNYMKLYIQNQFSTCGGIIKRSCFGYFEPKFRVAEDYAFCLLHAIHFKFALIPDIRTFYYRLRQDGTNLSLNKEEQKFHVMNVNQAKRKVFRLLSKHSLPQDLAEFNKIDLEGLGIERPMSTV